MWQSPSAARWGGSGLARAVDGAVAAQEKLSPSSPSLGNCYPRSVWKQVFMVGLGKGLVELFFPEN